MTSFKSPNIFWKIAHFPLRWFKDIAKYARHRDHDRPLKNITQFKAVHTSFFLQSHHHAELLLYIMFLFQDVQLFSKSSIFCNYHPKHKDYKLVHLIQASTITKLIKHTAKRIHIPSIYTGFICNAAIRSSICCFHRICCNSTSAFLDFTGESVLDFAQPIMNACHQHLVTFH